MLNSVSDKAGEKNSLSLDPRTKLFMVMVISVFMMSGSIHGNSIYPRMVLGGIPCFLLLTVKRGKMALLYLLSLAVASYAEAFWVYSTTGILSILITMFSGVVTRLFPCLVMGYYLMITTAVSQFIAAMERMHLPRVITIPLSVMFRFFPTIYEEYLSINDAMRMRGSGTRWIGNNPVTMLEFHLIPLICSIVKTGEELSVSALTRGLGCPEKRTNICRIGFGWQDLFFALLVVTAAIFYAILK